MQRPRKSLIGTSLLEPFTLEVWMLTLFALVLMGPLIFAIIKLRQKLVHSSGPKSRVYRLNECVWFTYGAIMKQGSPLDPTDDTTRLLFATWWIFITILTSYYTANLTAFLTLSRFSLPISHPEELAEKNIKWFGKSGGALEQAISGDDEEMQYLKDSLDSGQGQLIECTSEEIVNLVLQNHVYLGELRKVQSLVFENYMKNIDRFDDAISRCQMVNTLEPFLLRPMAIAFRDNSSYHSIFDPVLRTMVEGGVITHILNSNSSQSEVCPLNLGNAEKQLKLADFTSTYLAVTFGFLVAMLSFFGERFSSKFFKSKRKSKVSGMLTKKAFYPREFLQIQNSNNPVALDPKLFILNRVAGNTKPQCYHSKSLHFHYLD
ncbi:ionotropic receptor 93a [Cloeon dipterum]|uniref:ionotropic receptor 93a n=1 Tax=Cloeon dipterum TaxID=197152 RepID=UPI00321F866C